MSVRDRLGRLTGEDSKPHQADPRQERLSELRRKIEEVMNRSERLAPQAPHKPGRGSVPLEHVVAGEEVRSSHGAFFFSRSVLQPKESHGHSRVSDFSGPAMEAAAFLSGSDTIRSMTIEDGLFLDTETTGLAGGTGTFPFLIGLGWFDKGTFITCQLFARDFSEEKAMLGFLHDLAHEKGFLVTFNGRAYDLNLLAARFILSRMPDLLMAMPHMDLLHPSRRILSHRLENSRLVTIEAQVLGVRRQEDVPGYEIPQRYFDWLRSRDGRLMEDVFRHNRLDIVSMASLLKYLTCLVDGAADMSHAHHGDLLCAARLHHERGSPLAAERLLEGLRDSEQAGVAGEARKVLSLIHKRSGRWDEAVRLWQEVLGLEPHDLFAATELAKFYEHQAREFGRAHELVRDLLDNALCLSGEDRRLLEHRLHRLQGRAASKIGPGA